MANKKRAKALVGAGRGSRTLVSSLGRIHNSRYTIPAFFFFFHTPIKYGIINLCRKSKKH